MDPATENLLTQGGVFGAFFVFVTVPLALYTRQLATKLEGAQLARVEDAREVRTTLLGVTREFSESISEQVKTGAEVRGVYERILSALERLEKRIDTLAGNNSGPRK